MRTFNLVILGRPQRQVKAAKRFVGGLMQGALDAILVAFGKPLAELQEADVRSALGSSRARENGFLEYKSFPKDPRLEDPRSVEQHVVGPLTSFLNKPFQRCGALVMGIQDESRSARKGIPEKIVPLKLSAGEFSELATRLSALVGSRPTYSRVPSSMPTIRTCAIGVEGGIIGIVTCSSEISTVYFSRASDRVFVRNWDDCAELSSHRIEQLIEVRSRPYLAAKLSQASAKAAEGYGDKVREIELPIKVVNWGAKVAKSVTILMNVLGEVVSLDIPSWQDITHINPGASRVFQVTCQVIHPLESSTDLGMLKVRSALSAPMIVALSLRCDEGEFLHQLAIIPNVPDRNSVDVREVDYRARFYSES